MTPNWLFLLDAVIWMGCAYVWRTAYPKRKFHWLAYVLGLLFTVAFIVSWLH